MSMKMRWTNRQRFIDTCAVEVERDYNSTTKRLQDKFSLASSLYPNATAGVDITGIMDNQLDNYAKNTGWAGRRQMASARKDILNAAYSNAQLGMRYNNQDNQAFMDYVENQLNNL